MNPIQELAERLGGGQIIDGVEGSILLLRDAEAGFDWTGTAGLAAPGSETEVRFAAADLPRLLTTIAMLRAADLAFTGLDKSIANYLPESSVQQLGVVGGNDSGGDLTIRHLLGGTITRDGVPDSAAGIELAEAVLEEVLGAEIDDIHREFVLEPAGMLSTRLAETPTTTAGDLATLMDAVSSGRLITLDSWAEMIELGSARPGHDGSSTAVVERFAVGDHAVEGYRDQSGSFAFALPFGVTLSGTVDATGVDVTPLLDAVLEALC